MEKKILNDILHEFVDHIEYSKNGRKAEVKIKVFLKDEVNEIMNSMKDVFDLKEDAHLHPFFMFNKGGQVESLIINKFLFIFHV